MNITKDRFCFVPTVDFKTNWDDKKLFNYFNLSGNEIELIDSMIKPFASGQDYLFHISIFIFTNKYCPF